MHLSCKCASEFAPEGQLRLQYSTLERESGEDSTTPCGVKGVVGPGSRAQIQLAVEKTECPLQRTTTLTILL